MGLETAVGGVMNLGRQRTQSQQPAELIERRALSGEDVARQHRLGALVENIGLVGAGTPAVLSTMTVLATPQQACVLCVTK